MSDMMTEASYRETFSINSLDFNANEEISLYITTKPACFAAGFLRRTGRLVFEQAIEQIDSKVATELCNIMVNNSCNKSTSHNYTHVYHLILHKYRDIIENFTEIGIGTNNQDVPSRMSSSYIPGSSLRAWREYFRKACIVGADIDPRILFEEERISTYYVNQTNPAALYSFAQKSNIAIHGCDVILDDGLHEYRSNITMLTVLWPFIRKNGIYIIEDIFSENYMALMAFIESLSLNADVCGMELPSETKADNRIIVLQKR